MLRKKWGAMATPAPLRLRGPREFHVSLANMVANRSCNCCALKGNFFHLCRSDDGSFEHGFTLPDSITTWEISAIAMNSQTGFGLSNTVNIESRMNLFVHLKIPASVQRREQITVYAVVYNFNARETRVRHFISLIIFLGGGPRTK